MSGTSSTLSRSADRKRKRRADEQSRTVGDVKVRRGTKNVDQAVRRRQEADMFALPQQEFTNRRRFVDLEGNSYAPPKPEDPIFQRYQHTKRLASLAGDGLPSYKSTVEVGRARGILRGRALLYIRKRRTQKLTIAPRGEVQLLDTESMTLYTGRVETAMLRRESKSGHVVLRDLTDFGTLADPSEFNLRP